MTNIQIEKSTREIAEELFIGIKTIGNHRTNISAKLNISGHNALMKNISLLWSLYCFGSFFY